jgi:hypothetical protein
VVVDPDSGPCEFTRCTISGNSGTGVHAGGSAVSFFDSTGVKPILS